MATWQFRPLNQNDNSGISTVDDNFANEERSSVEILVRETLQNPLDARQDNEMVEVHYNIVSVDRSTSEFLPQVFSPDAMIHMRAGKLLKEEDAPNSVSFLVVEDFGTTGLEGVYTDSSVDGSGENWNAFWFREGEGAKPARSNGGAGQGKITLYAASGVRSVLALTHRRSDDKELLFGCCRFKQNYKIYGRNERWAKEARWGATANPDDLALPLEDSDLIDLVKSELKLARGNHAGTSFIVPSPIDISLVDIQRAVINEFFFPIRRGRLRVVVGDVVMDRDTIAAHAKALGNKARYEPAYTHFLENAIDLHIGVAPTAVAKPTWTQSNKLTDAVFEPAELALLKARFEKSEIVSVDFPVKIRKKDGPPVSGDFRVVLRQQLDGDQSQELFVRQDLGIDGEKRLKGSRRIQPVLALTFIHDFQLSGFLVAAEEPTHRTWNASRPKVNALYTGTSALLNAVRNAALRLVELLTPAGRRDTTALALYFADPNSAQEKPRRGPDGKGNPIPPIQPGVEKPIIPPAKPKPLSFIPLETGFSIRAIKAEMEKKTKPVFVQIKTAYATTLGDAFKQWDAADFWLNDESKFNIEESGISEIIRDGNILKFQIDDDDARVTLLGFDKNRKVEVQINYHESENAENLEND